MEATPPPLIPKYIFYKQKPPFCSDKMVCSVACSFFPLLYLQIKLGKEKPGSNCKEAPPLLASLCVLLCGEQPCLLWMTSWAGCIPAQRVALGQPAHSIPFLPPAGLGAALVCFCQHNCLLPTTSELGGCSVHSWEAVYSLLPCLAVTCCLQLWY